jgi:DNA-binding NtrC family response regulator
MLQGMLRIPFSLLEGHDTAAGVLEEGRPLRIGRGGPGPAPASKEPEAQAHLCSSSSVSQQHVELKINANGELVAKDLDSTNGTWLRMVPFQEYRLPAAFELQLGGSVFLRGGFGRMDPLREPNGPFGSAEDLAAFLRARLREQAEQVTLCSQDEAAVRTSTAREGLLSLPLRDERFLVLQWRPGTANTSLERWVCRCVRRFNQEAIQKDGPSAELPGWKFTAASEGRAQARSLAAALAPTQCTLLLLGPTGCGKEILARDIHNHSRRAARPFVPVNCGAIPENLLESELFGSRSGAFSGAQNRDGLFQAAHGGTLFLDEIGDLPLSQQVKILRALQERRIRKVGDTREEPVDVRIIAATHRDLADMVEKGTFREDLYYRLSDVGISIGALAALDVLEMVPGMLEQLGRSERVEVSESEQMRIAQLAALMRWPGNGRELFNALRRYIALRRSELTADENWARSCRGRPPVVRSASASPVPPPAPVASGAQPAPAASGPKKIKDTVDQIDNMLFLVVARRVMGAAHRGDLVRLGAELGMTGAGASARLHRLGIKTKPAVDLAAVEAALEASYAALRSQLGWVREALRL